MEPWGIARVTVRPGAVALLLIGAAVLVRVPTLGQPLLGIHAFRQTQTAYGSLQLHDNGYDLLHAQVPVLGEPWQIPFEFPLFQASAATLISAGLDPDAAARTASLGWFALAAALTWLLVRRLAGNLAAGLALAWFLFMPLSLMWSRSATIEYLAVAASVAALLGTIRWLDTSDNRWLVAALAAATVAALVKSTTWAAWMIAVVFLALAMRRHGRSRAFILGGVTAVVAVSGAAAAAWTSHADSIKATSLWTDDLTSSQLLDWVFGTPAQRLDPEWWVALVGAPAVYVLGVVGVALLPAAARGILASRERLALAGLALVAVVPPLLMFSLYARHEYYQIATSPAWAAILGVGAAAMLSVARSHARGAGLVVATLAGAVLVGAPYWGLAFAGTIDPADALGLARRVSARTSQGDLIVVEGMDWSPEILYYSRRRGIALPNRPLDEVEWAALKSLRPALLVLPFPDDASRVSIMRAWPSVAPVDTRMYLVAASLSSLIDESVVWTQHPPSGADDPDATRNSIDLDCGEPAVSIAPAPPGSVYWLRLLGEAAGEARIWVTDGLGPLPASGVVRVRDTSMLLRCAGVESLSVDWTITPDKQ